MNLTHNECPKPMEQPFLTALQIDMSSYNSEQSGLIGEIELKLNSVINKNELANGCEAGIAPKLIDKKSEIGEQIQFMSKNLGRLRNILSHLNEIV